MMAIGCIQAQKCHTGFCPAGIATQNKWLQRGVDVQNKAKYFSNYIKAFRKELLSLAHTAGYEHPSQVTMDDLEVSTGINKFSTLKESMGYSRKPVEFTSMKDYQPIE